MDTWKNLWSVHARPYLPYLVDERPYDGRSVVVPLSRGRRFQVTFIVARSRNELALTGRAFTWTDD